MKKSFLLLFVILLGLSCKRTSVEVKSPPSLVEETNVSATANTTVAMTIEGMVCAMGCAAVIEKKLNATPGIVKATVDFPSKKAVIDFDDQLLNPNAIIAVVKGVGEAYSVSEFSLQ